MLTMMLQMMMVLLGLLQGRCICGRCYRWYAPGLSVANKEGATLETLDFGQFGHQFGGELFYIYKKKKHNTQTNVRIRGTC